MCIPWPVVSEPRGFACPRLLWAWIGLLVVLSWSRPADVHAVDALVLGRHVLIRQTPQMSGTVLKSARPGETYDVPGRRPRKRQPVYLLDEQGHLWVKIRVRGEQAGFVRTDEVSVAREEYRSPRGQPRLIVNLRPTGDGGVSRELWVVEKGWQRTRRLAVIEGRPIWASHGDWFICQVDSGRPVKDQTMERTVERIEKFSADGHIRSVLAAGSYPVLNEARGEIYFYRDVDDHGDAVPHGLFAVGVNGGAPRSVYALPERYKFWKEDGDYFVQAPPPVLHTGPSRISFYAFEPTGSRVRFMVSPEGQFLHRE